MKNFHLSLIACGCIGTLHSEESKEYRKWTRQADKGIIEATITDTKRDHSEVRFLMKDGRTPWVKTEILIPTDQEVIKQWMSEDDRFAAELAEEHRKGRELTAEQARELAANLSDSKDSAKTRFKLIGYYSSIKPHTPEIALERARQIFWLIENIPEGLRQIPFLHFLDRIDQPYFEKAKTLWIAQVEAHSKNLEILGNAAQWFQFKDPKLAEDCLLKAQLLEPAESWWWDRLGDLYARGGLDDSLLSPEKALAAYEKAEACDKSSFLPQVRAMRMAKVAYQSGAFEKAGKRVSEVLEYADTQPDGYFSGELVHTCYTILGLLAIKDGDTAAAKDHLLKSGRTKGSPGLNSSGPSMMLANELLVEGEKATVLEYFTLCSKFWKSKGWLEKASQQVSDGITPDFGHLLKHLP